jgi:hypothetical protein
MIRGGKQGKPIWHAIRALSWGYVEPEVGFEPTTFRLRVEEPSSTRCYRGLFLLVTSARSSAECAPDLPSYGRWNDQGNDQADPREPLPEA